MQWIQWEDHFTMFDSMEYGSILDTWVMETVGFIIAENDKMIAIAHTHLREHNGDSAKFKEVTHILKADILRRKTLK